jgi:peptide/nickel transport system substrate-binding protein
MKSHRILPLVAAALLLIAVALPTQAQSPKRGGTITLSFDVNPWSMDPNKIPGIVGGFVDYHIYDGLYNYNSRGEAVLALAESAEQPGPLTYVFKLRRGVTFHNGRPFTAQDVKYTFDRIMAPGAQGILSSPLRDGVKSVEAVDQFTVRITLKESWPEFEKVLANYGAKIVNREAIEAAGTDYGVKVAVGTGSFKFIEWLTDDRVVLERNPNYWKKPLPYLDRIVIRIIPDPQVRSINVLNRTIDVDMVAPFKELRNFRQNDSLQVLAGLSNTTEIVWLNTSQAPFNQKALRQAFHYGINRDLILRTVFAGYAEPAVDLFPPHYWVHDANLEAPYDPDRATRLLQEAGYSRSNPVKFDLLVTNLPIFVDQAVLIQNQLNRVGFQVNITPVDQTTLFDYLEGRRGRRKTEWQAALQQYAASGMTAFDFAWKRYYSKAPQNYMQYNVPGGASNPRVDELLDRARSELDRGRAKTMYGQISRMILEDAPAIRLSFVKAVVVAQKHVKGLEVPELSINTLFDTAWLDK